MENKYTVKGKEISFIEVEKSKFYGIIFKINSKDDFLKELEVIKKEYPKARHYCYAYVLENEKKSSDNGEPTNTAGKPILNILEVHSLINVGLVVVRYFGETLLGAGRLTRSYALAAEEAFKKSTILKLVEKKKVRVLVDLDSYDKFLGYLKVKQYISIKTLFNDRIIVDFLADKDFEKESLDIFLKKVEYVGEVSYLDEEEVKWWLN